MSRDIELKRKLTVDILVNLDGEVWKNSLEKIYLESTAVNATLFCNVKPPK